MDGERRHRMVEYKLLDGDYKEDILQSIKWFKYTGALLDTLPRFWNYARKGRLN